MRHQKTDTGWIAAGWPAPSHIHAGVTTRTGGLSIGSYASLNLATHVGDHADTVMSNRKLLRDILNLPEEPAWLEQVHDGLIIPHSISPVPPRADGAYTQQKFRICAVLTADCLPLLLCDIAGQEIAAVHIGWRGYCANIVTHAISAFTEPPEKLLAWIGPYITHQHYEVGDEVRSSCLNIAGDGSIMAFSPSRPGHWYADLGMLVKQALVRLGVTQIHDSMLCTYSDPSRFYSYRREGTTGRQASLIWMT